MANRKLQYVCLLQFRMLGLAITILGILMLGGLQDEGLQYGQALIDAGTSTLFHEWFIRTFANVLRRGYIL